jgi:dihydrofolate reductase
VISIVVAYGSNGAIGYRGRLPWRLPSDLRRFRELTAGNTVVMGRRTFEGLPPQHRPLRDRHNVVISANPDFRPPGVDMVPGAAELEIHASLGSSPAATALEIHTSLDSALAAHGSDCFVIGGASIYEQALPLAGRVYATRVEASPEADAFFPELSPEDWRCVEEGDPIVENHHRFVFRIFERNTASASPASPGVP